MKMPPSSISDNRNSSMLTIDENQQVFQLLGHRCQSVVTCIVQLYCTQPPSHSQWVKRDTGVLCFVKDNGRKNYFFRLYCLKRGAMVWEHEIYNDMEYNASTDFLHTFEGEDCIVGFNFASVEEARDLKNVVDQKVLAKKRREERKSRNLQNHTIKTEVTQDYFPVKKTKDAAERLAKRKRNITKADISQPSQFRHIAHVGFDPMTGFDVNGEDAELNEFFKKAGVSQMQLQDRDTREFIYDFICRNGGREAAVQQVKQTSTTKLAPPAPPSPVAGPPVPPRGSTRSHSRVAPAPPPTPTQTLRQPPKIPQLPPPPPGNAPPPPPLPSANAPPPPPPPPMNIPPPPPPLAEDIETTITSTKPDVRSALMESIREGTNLKPVEMERKPSIDNARGDLLSEIRKGFQLKPTSERELKPVTPPAEQKPDLASALAKALANRNKAFHSEDDDDSETDSNDDDDEWDDQ